MIHTGLCSVTFRQLDPAAIVALVRQARLDAIEWGGDVHVPHGDVETARAVQHMTLDAGLRIASYGSYYRVGQTPESFADVLASAVALGAPVIRVWAGAVGSAEADEVTWGRVVEDARRIAAMAQAQGLVTAFEYHPNTLTDTDEAAARLLAAVDHPGMRSYWQMRDGASFDEHLTSLGSILPWLTHVHVQSSRDGQRRPLAALAQAWQQILAIVASLGHDHAALIEFVHGDAPEQFLADAATLKRVSEKANRRENE